MKHVKGVYSGSEKITVSFDDYLDQDPLLKIDTCYADLLLLLPGYDNRCLKPDDNKPAEKWDHYDPDEFYEAINKESELYKIILLPCIVI